MKRNDVIQSPRPGTIFFLLFIALKTLLKQHVIRKTSVASPNCWCFKHERVNANVLFVFTPQGILV